MTIAKKKKRLDVKERVWGERRQIYVERNCSLLFSLLLCVRMLHIRYVIADKTEHLNYQLIPLSWPHFQ